ncbi:hypothetical protein GCM10027442_09690 [Emticicia fontis]
MVTSIFVKGSSANYEKIQGYYFTASQDNTANSVSQDWDSTIPYDLLSILSSGEEVDPTDESTGDDTIESEFPLHISYFNYNFLESSFINFNLSLQKRITIPFFLLHHSWKIPFN